MCFRIELAAIDAARNCRRRYRVEAGQDLFGDWLVTITFGRLGAPGRTIVHVVDDERQARRLVKACLRVRATAPRRIGVAYRERARSAPQSWSDIVFDGRVQPATDRPASA
ncbi:MULTISPECIES: WGR domain-containing protein [unclassified Sphingomonas]|uniref:WGR domain-containing protein n=1 Tax=unclassified Sphingomonas TaxID=196159 RepID=UPI00226A599D|nr:MULTISPECIES: WGR domain-containing protein [unclassified Sphingomonas]